MEVIPLILCGGSGTRLWPSSRKAYPKQFAPLLGTESLFQATLKRVAAPMFGQPIIATNDDFRFLVAEQAEGVGLADPAIILEPSPRNTAPAILSAALTLRDSPDALLLVSPSDHLISEPGSFHAAVKLGLDVAREGNLITFGVKPHSPETGYGYIEVSHAHVTHAPTDIRAFVEKPDADTARAMLKRGNFLWNAGIFLFRVKDLLAAFEHYAADLLVGCSSAVEGGKKDLGFLRLEEASYQSLRSVSIDYAIMEKASNISVVPLDCGWSDLGTWKALWSALPKTAGENVAIGSVTELDCERTFLRSEDEGIQLVGVGLRNIVGVAMRDAVLIADLDRDQDIKRVVETLKAAQAPQAEQYPRFHRPWGWYETLCLGQRFQVKRIMVKPGGILSLQSHFHRAEHWVVVSGTAKVTVGDRVQILTENESVYVPLGAVHRMENPGRVPMFLIEVQTGAYLGEDDIIRYEDVYRR